MIRAAVICSDEISGDALSRRLKNVADAEKIMIEIETFGLKQSKSMASFFEYDVVLTDIHDIARAIQDETVHIPDGTSMPRLIFIQPEVFIQTVTGRKTLNRQVLVPVSNEQALENLLHSTLLHSEFSHSILVSSQGREIKLSIDDILYIDQMLKRCVISCADRVIDTQASLDKLEQEIDSRWFLRADPTLLVNRAHIAEHNKLQKTFIMDNGAMIGYMSKKRPSPYEIFGSKKVVL